MEERYQLHLNTLSRIHEEDSLVASPQLGMSKSQKINRAQHIFFGPNRASQGF